MHPTIWRLRLNAPAALRLLADLDQCYQPLWRPAVTGFVGAAGVALYVQPRHAIDSGLLLLLADYGGVEAPSQLLPEGLTWADGPQLAAALTRLITESEVCR